MGNNLIEVLNGIYFHIDVLYGYDRKTFIKKEQKIRKLISQYDDSLSAEDMKKIDSSVAIEDVYVYLKQCHNEYEAKVAENKKLEDLIIQKLCPSAKKAFEILNDPCVFGKNFLLFDGQDVTIRVYYYNFSCFTITLKNAEIVEEFPQTIFFGYSLSETNNKYCMKMADDSCCIIFESAEVNYKVYSVLNVDIYDNPWNYLEFISENLVVKDELKLPLNEKETEILPLAKALCSVFDKDFEQDDVEIFPFVKLAGEMGFDIAEIISKPDKFCSIKYEPLWRKTYDMFKESQAEYPSMVEELCNAEDLSKARNEISEVMKKNSFSGEYPNFYKSADFKLPKLVSSYNSCCVVSQKYMVHHIKCIENYDNGLRLSFVCGFIRNKNESDKTKNDAFSCMFDEKGNRYFKSINSFSNDNCTQIDLSESRELAEIAVKKATMQKLTKAESDKCYCFKNISNLEIILMCIFGGLLFCIAMTIGFIVIEFVVVMIFTRSFSNFCELFMDTPWWYIIVFCIVGFSGVMMILSLLANKK